MAIHVCRDFVTKFSLPAAWVSLYVSSMFLHGVMQFSIVGQTSFNLAGATFLKGSGNNADINLGAGAEFAVYIDPGVYAVSTADVNRILALKSASQPLMNSGLFRVTGINTALNYLYINYRSLNTPPPETGLAWKLYEREDLVRSSFSNSSNTGLNDGQYHGNLTSTSSRIIFQSQHATSWQVRICAEWYVDALGTTGTSGSGYGWLAACSFAPGYEGNSAGDFAVAGRHLHIPLWFNCVDGQNASPTPPYNTRASVPGFGSKSVSQTSQQTITSQRYYMWGDDQTGTCFIAARSTGDSLSEGVVSFGLAENEELPLPDDPIHRLFSFGSTGNYGIEMEPGSFLSAQADKQMGTAFGFSNQPISCVPVGYCYLSGQTINTSISTDSSASDDIYLNKTVMYPWDLVAGTWDHTDDADKPYLNLEPRRLGSFPFARKGRENYNTWSTSTDSNRSWLHIQYGIYLPWSGSVLP